MTAERNSQEPSEQEETAEQLKTKREIEMMVTVLSMSGNEEDLKSCSDRLFGLTGVRVTNESYLGRIPSEVLTKVLDSITINPDGSVDKKAAPEETADGISNETIAEINSAQAGVEKEVSLGSLCSVAFATEDYAAANNITPEMVLGAKNELAEMGYDLKHAQMLADNGMSAGQIASRLRLIIGENHE